jgi:hypothetical protein
MLNVRVLDAEQEPVILAQKAVLLETEYVRV